jgi:hypothetical protein
VSKRTELPSCFQPKLYVCPHEDCGYIGSAAPQWRLPGADKAPCFGCGRELDDADLHVFGPESGGGDQPSPKYHGVRRDWPPIQTALVVWATWWGCPHWLVRANRVDDQGHLQPQEQVGAIINAAAAQLDAAVDADLRLPIFVKSTIVGEEAKTDLAEIPIGANPRYGVNPDFLAYCSAHAEVERWRWLSPFDMQDAKGVTQQDGVLLGLRGDDLVAVVSPVDMEAE